MQDGEDTRQETEVQREQLQELVALCKRLLKKKDREEAAELLPPLDDVFKTEDEENYYWEEAYWWELKATLRQLGPCSTTQSSTTGNSTTTQPGSLVPLSTKKSVHL